MSYRKYRRNSSQQKKHYTIEPAVANPRAGTDGSGFWLVEHGRYERSSVLAGQDYRRLITHADSVKELVAVAKERGIKARVVDHTTRPEPYGFESNPLPPAPPAWFDPADAGEVWHEDDY